MISPLFSGLWADPEGERVNMLSMAVLGLRVLLAKSIAFNTLMSIKLFLFWGKGAHSCQTVLHRPHFIKWSLNPPLLFQTWAMKARGTRRRAGKNVNQQHRGLNQQWQSCWQWPPRTQGSTFPWRHWILLTPAWPDDLHWRALSAFAVSSSLRTEESGFILILLLSRSPHSSGICIQVSSLLQ